MLRLALLGQLDIGRSLGLLKSYPSLQVGNLIRQTLGRHLDASNLAGELAYLKTAGQFERPYGYAWILKVSAELSDWKDPDGQKWAANMAPLATWASSEMTTFLHDLTQPNRGGVHPNSAFGMYMMLDYVDGRKADTLATRQPCSTRRRASTPRTRPATRRLSRPDPTSCRRA